MKSLRDLKKRIKSIKNTEKMTNALEKVSISKMKKFQNLATQSKEYANDIANYATLISGIYKKGNKNLNYKLTSRYFKKKEIGLPHALIVIAPTRGFCGNMINDMLYVLNENLDENIKYIGIGIQKKSQYIMSKFKNIEIESVFEKAVENPEFNSIEAPFNFAFNNYLNGKVGKIFIFYTEYRGSFNYKPVFKQLLPLNYDDLIQYIDNDEEIIEHNEDYTIEPNQNMFFEKVIERYLKTIFLYSFITSKASEHNARMIAMKNATDNAKDLRNVLNLQFNKSRQEAITTELLDIIGGTINN